MVSGLTAMPVSTAADADLAGLVDFDFGTGGDEAAERGLHLDAAAAARRQRTAPAGLARRQVERGGEAWRFAEHIAAEGDRILAGFFRQLVDEALDGEDVVVGADAAPEAGRHRR